MCISVYDVCIVGVQVTIFFYNPNIHPRKEYEIRKEENKRYALRHGVPFVDCDYDQRSWFQRMQGLEYDPERGVRCTACFDMRMEVAVAYAAAHGFPAFTTTNATSRWKDVQQVNDAGLRAAARYAAAASSAGGTGGAGSDSNGGAAAAAVVPRYWVYNWQTDAMTKRKYEVSAEERFYKQEYCGCAYSLRDSNLWRRQNGIPAVRVGGTTAGLGTRYFEDPEADAAEESQEVVDAFFAEAATQFNDDDHRDRVQAKEQDELHRLKTQFEGRQKNVDVAELNNW